MKLICFAFSIQQITFIEAGPLDPEDMNLDYMLKLADSNPVFRLQLNDSFMEKTFLRFTTKVIFGQLNNRPAQLNDSELRIHRFETGLRLLKFFGHKVNNIEFDTSYYTYSQAMQLSSYIHKHCANTLVHLVLSGDKVPSVMSEPVHFRNLRWFHIDISGSEKFYVPYTFDQLTNFKATVAHPSQLPVEVIEKNSGLTTVVLPNTSPKDTQAYLRHAMNADNIYYVGFKYVRSGGQIDNEVADLLSEFGYVKIIDTTVYMMHGDDSQAQALISAAKSVWRQTVFWNLKGSVNDEESRVLVFRT